MIERPKFKSVPLTDGLKWTGGGGWLYEEKLDGVWHIAEMSFAETSKITIAGELMRDGTFYAFDLLFMDGQDLRLESLRTRFKLLDDITPLFSLQRPARGIGGDFLAAVLERGTEGIVAKRLDAPFGEEWIKCKRAETFDLIVAEKHHFKTSIRVMEPSGEDRGWVPCRKEYDRVNLGDVVEIGGYALTSARKIREPRFIRVRHDKMVIRRNVNTLPQPNPFSLIHSTARLASSCHTSSALTQRSLTGLFPLDCSRFM